MASQIKLRRDTAANWTSINPVLANGEPGLETDTRKVKYGNGSTAWNSLSYASAGVTSYNDLSDKPNLATVATSGSYNDLTDKPAGGVFGNNGWTPIFLDSSIVATGPGAFNCIAGSQHFLKSAESYNKLIISGRFPDGTSTNNMSLGMHAITGTITDVSQFSVILTGSSANLFFNGSYIGTSQVPSLSSTDLLTLEYDGSYGRVYVNGDLKWTSSGSCSSFSTRLCLVSRFDGTGNRIQDIVVQGGF